MIHKVTASLLLTLTALASFAQGNKVAIPEVVDKEGNVSYAVRLMVRSNLTKAISEKQGYAAYDRVDIGALMEEHSFQRTGLVDDRTIRKLGEMTGCNLVLIAEVASIDHDNYYVSAKIVEIETAKTRKIESALMGTSATSIQKGCDELVGKLLGTTRISSTNIRAANPTPNKAVVLVTGLRVFPYDIGEFNVAPYQTIQSLNQKKTFGYSNWRLPTRDELSLLRANSASLGDLKNEQYMVSNPASGQVDEISYGGVTGWVRLVSDGWTQGEKKEIRKKAILDICGLTDDYIVDEDLGAIIDPNDIPIQWDKKYTPPPGWEVANGYDVRKYQKQDRFYLDNTYSVGPNLGDYSDTYNVIVFSGAWINSMWTTIELFKVRISDFKGTDTIYMNSRENNTNSGPWGLYNGRIKSYRYEIPPVTTEYATYYGTLYVKLIKRFPNEELIEQQIREKYL